MVLDCRPPLLPGVMNVTVMDLAEIQSSTMASEAATVPPEREQSFGGGDLLLLKFAQCWIMEADGCSVVDNRAGVTFGVELYIPWDAPEAVVDILTADAVPLRNVPDVFRMVGHRDSATESRVLPGRGVRVLVPDCRGLHQNFHDVTVVDMGNLPESHVSMSELSKLIHKWPPAVINHMMWRQRVLEEMRRAARVKYRQKHTSLCTFYGTLIRCDMYRHVARCHLELAQVWRCPVSWCTVCKGLDGPCLWGSQCAAGDKGGQPREALPAMDGNTPGVHRIADISTLRHLKRCDAVQRYRAVVGPPLPGAQEAPPPCRVSEKLYVAAARSSAFACGSANQRGIARPYMLVSAMCGGVFRCCMCIASTVQTHDRSPAANSGHGVTC